MRRHIPNILTVSNLFCGVIGSMLVLVGELWGAVIMVSTSLLADFLDGFVARRLGVSSPIGKELDSLADMVSFGVLPGLVLFRMSGALQAGEAWLEAGTWPGWQMILIGLASLQVPIFSAARLAKFNIDVRQSDHFIGVPTPANTILIVSLWMIATLHPDAWVGQALAWPWLIAGLGLVLSGLLVAELPLLALKFKDFTWAHNRSRYLLLGGSAALLICFQYLALPAVFLLYLGLSVIALRREE
jgi:CDP-diacylglycerol--serine O-phosphatidyltransferase